MYHVKKVGVAAALVLLALLMTACGKERTVTILDQSMRYEVTVSEGQTVGHALEEAGIVLDSRDLVEPPAHTKIADAPESITISRYSRVSIRDMDQEYSVELTGGTVADALEAAGLTLGENEHPSLPETERLQDGMTIEILHQKAVHVKLYGETREWKTNASTVGELLEELGISLGENDLVSPNLDDAITHGSAITVSSVSYEERTEVVEIPFEREERKSYEMVLGTETVTQTGVPGLKQVSYRVTLEDGREIARELLSETVLSEPVTEIVTLGAAQVPSGGGSSGGTPQDVRTIVSREAVPDCADGSHGYYVITYSDGSVEYEVY